MNLKGIRLAALDLDGTLLREDKTISNYTFSVIQKLIGEGLLIVPATGRNLPGMKDNILKIPRIPYAICSNGAQVFRLRDKKLIYEAPIFTKDALAVIRYLEQYPTCLYIHTDQGTRRSANWREMTLTKHFPFIRFEDREIVDLTEFILKNKCKVIKIGAFVLDDDAFRELSQKGSPLPSVAQFRTGEGILELNSSAASKAQGLNALCSHLGISASQILAIGDNGNDLSMLRMAGISAAMGNGGGDVKAAARFVTGTNEEDGAAAFLARYFHLAVSP